MKLIFIFKNFAKFTHDLEKISSQIANIENNLRENRILLSHKESEITSIQNSLDKLQGMVQTELVETNEFLYD